MAKRITMNKKVREKMRKHILKEFIPKEEDQITALAVRVNELKNKLRVPEDHVQKNSLVASSYLRHTKMSAKDFLNKELKINPKGKYYSDEQSLKLYKHLLTRETKYLLNKRRKKLKRIYQALGLEK